jgi:hypothetical protein
VFYVECVRYDSTFLKSHIMLTCIISILDNNSRQMIAEHRGDGNDVVSPIVDMDCGSAEGDEPSHKGPQEGAHGGGSFAYAVCDVVGSP